MRPFAARCSQELTSCPPLRRPAGVPRQHQQGARSNVVPHSRSEYRRNVGICLVDNRGLVFAARRCDDTSGTWQMPQGGIDPGETPAEAAVRELREETGITSARIVAEVNRWLSYDFPTAVRNRLTGSIQRYRGQMQKWLCLHFTGEEGEIDLEAGGEREFLEHRWMPLEELPGRVVPFKADVYAAVAAEFGPLIRRQLSSGRMGDAWWGDSTQGDAG